MNNPGVAPINGTVALPTTRKPSSDVCLIADALYRRVSPYKQLQTLSPIESVLVTKISAILELLFDEYPAITTPPLFVC
jgi:hypothetical protein